MSVPSLPSTVRERAQSSTTDVPQGLTDQTNYLPRRKIISVFLACATVDIAGLLDETMLAVSLPIIGSELNAGSQVSWFATAYFVASTSCQLLYGRLSDIWSRKTVLFALMFIFFIGNLGSAFSKTFIQLAIFRGIAGAGGGGLPTLAQVIVSDVVSLRQRGKYQGILGISVAFSHGVGPIIGGLLSENSTWRWIFRLTLPLTVVAAVMVWYFMPLKPTEGNWKHKIMWVDYVGALLILSGSTLIVLALTWAGGLYSWDSKHVLITLILGVISSVIFVFWEWKGPRFPLLSLHIFRERVVIGAAITQWINGFLSVVQLFYLPTYYQAAYGYSPVKSGLLLLPLTVVQTFISTASGALVTWTGRYRELILSGWAMWAIGLGLLGTLNERSSLAQQIGYSILTGVGVGQTFQPSLVAVQGAIERKEMASVTAMRSFVRNLGGSLGLAVTGTIVNNVLSTYLTSLNVGEDVQKSILDHPELARTLPPDVYAEVLHGYLKGFRLVFNILAGLAVFAFLAAFFLMPHRDLDRPDDKQLKQEGKEFIAQLKGKKGTTIQKDPVHADVGDVEKVTTAAV
ncbi:Efflux pump FUS6 [Hypsizygus marmoreus]|uniref:Efflux pump FUS6 n=1 Tax=Hypsizygus marmoreus TaxID=39966 RepID=A0A369JB39_HYPMA|nr:Efflux pump FUS6 [Hypsizygus marmoreus]